MLFLSWGDFVISSWFVLRLLKIDLFILYIVYVYFPVSYNKVTSPTKLVFIKKVNKWKKSTFLTNSMYILSLHTIPYYVQVVIAFNSYKLTFLINLNRGNNKHGIHSVFYSPPLLSSRQVYLSSRVRISVAKVSSDRVCVRVRQYPSPDTL